MDVVATDSALVDVGHASDAAVDARPDAHADAAPPDAPSPDAPFVDAPSRDLTSVAQTAYVKASNTYQSSIFGYRTAMSADGTTMAISAPQEPSAATGIDSNQLDRSAPNAGAVYVFTYGTTWTQQAYIKPSDTRANGMFGDALALSADGSTLAVGASGVSSTAGGGTVYVFTRTGTTWTQQARFKASNTRGGDEFGHALAMSGDGGTIAVGAYGESSNATGIDGNQADTSAMVAGAAYVFVRSGSTWTQQAYIKASNTEILDGFGHSIALSWQGQTLAVGAPAEASSATGINGDQADNTQSYSGAVYVFTRIGAQWKQEAYVKASNTHHGATFGEAVALSDNGSALVVGSDNECSAATGIDGNQTDVSACGTGAAYMFHRAGTTWSQDTYIKPSNQSLGEFGYRLAMSADAHVVLVGAFLEPGAATGINGDETIQSPSNSGAAYLYVQTNGTWSQLAYVKSSNPANGTFGRDVAIAADGSTFVIGAIGERSNATGIDGNQLDTSMMSAGAAYVFR